MKTAIEDIVESIAYKIFNQSFIDREKTLEINVLNTINPQFRKIDERLTRQENIHPHSTKDRTILPNIEANIRRHGFDWGKDEDKCLGEELERAIGKIVLGHKRTSGAIRSRINQKDLVWG